MVQLVMHIVPSGDVLTLSREYSYSFGTLNTIVSMAKFTYYHLPSQKEQLNNFCVQIEIPIVKIICTQ